LKPNSQIGPPATTSSVGYAQLLKTLCLKDAGAVQQEGVTHPGIPGYEATLHVFHAENPKTVYEAVLSKLTESLKV
jgi:hypothetical protein